MGQIPILLYSYFVRENHMIQGSLPPRHTLTVKDAAALEAFYYAQRPHDDVLSWRELRAAGAKPKPKEDPALKFVCVAFNTAYGAELDYSKVETKPKKEPTPAA